MIYKLKINGKVLPEGYLTYADAQKAGERIRNTRPVRYTVVAAEDLLPSKLSDQEKLALREAIDLLSDAIDEAADGQEAWREHGPYRLIIQRTKELNGIAEPICGPLKKEYETEHARKGAR